MTAEAPYFEFELVERKKVPSEPSLDKSSTSHPFLPSRADFEQVTGPTGKLLSKVEIRDACRFEAEGWQTFRAVCRSSFEPGLRRGQRHALLSRAAWVAAWCDQLPQKTLNIPGALSPTPSAGIGFQERRGIFRETCPLECLPRTLMSLMEFGRDLSLFSSLSSERNRFRIHGAPCFCVRD